MKINAANRLFICGYWKGGKLSANVIGRSDAASASRTGKPGKSNGAAADN